MRCAILTVSTGVSRERRDDAGGRLLAQRAEEAGADVQTMEVVPDDYGLIEDLLLHYVESGYDVVLTTGGTGLTPDDLTPEATSAVIEREIPGLAEAMRAESLRRTPMGALSRGIAGASRSTLIVNFPGSPKAIDEVFGVVGPVLAHAVALLHGDHGH